MRAVAEEVRAAPMRGGCLLAHLLLVALLAPLSYLLYRYTPTELSVAGIVVLWGVVGVASVLAGLLAMAPLALWRDAARALGAIWWYAAIAALLGSGIMQVSQSLWTPTASLTFDLGRRLLVPIVPTLPADPVTLEHSTQPFALQIAARV